MDKGTILRTLALATALINQFLTMFDLNPIPGSYELWYETLTMAFTVGASVWCWFWNNYLTVTGRKQKEVLKDNGLIRGGK